MDAFQIVQTNMQSKIRIVVSGQVELKPPRTEQRRGVKDRLLLVFVTTVFQYFLSIPFIFLI